MPSVNQRIGEYVLQSKIAAGTFGEVWLGRHHAWADELVAVKIPTDADYIRNLQHEGNAVRNLSHVGIVRAINFDPFAEIPYLVMEYVPGTSLRTVIQRGPMQAEDATAVLRQVLEALVYAHAQNIIHRDIKPENVLIHERTRTEGFAASGVVKLTDFGLGKTAGASAGSIMYSASIADARNIVGTLQYMAPEQRDGGEIDGRADLYACGVVLYEMLTGRRPAGLTLPSEENPAVPKHLDEIFRRAYARVDCRFASANEFLTALRAPSASGVSQQPADRPLTIANLVDAWTPEETPDSDSATATMEELEEKFAGLSPEKKKAALREFESYFQRRGFKKRDEPEHTADASPPSRAPQSAPVPATESRIDKLWMEHNVRKDSWRTEQGTILHIAAALVGLAGESCMFKVYYVKPSAGERPTLEEAITAYEFTAIVTPPYEHTTYADIPIFVPYGALAVFSRPGEDRQLYVKAFQMRNGKRVARLAVAAGQPFRVSCPVGYRGKLGGWGISGCMAGNLALIAFAVIAYRFTDPGAKVGPWVWAVFAAVWSLIALAENVPLQGLIASVIPCAAGMLAWRVRPDSFWYACWIPILSFPVALGICSVVKESLIKARRETHERRLHVKETARLSGESSGPHSGIAVVDVVAEDDLKDESAGILDLVREDY